MKIVASVYSHPDYYPPTLNSIEILARQATYIEIISRNVKQDQIIFPKNVVLKKSGNFMPIRDTECASYLRKIMSFLNFSSQLYKSLSHNSPEWLIVYDPIPLLAFKLIQPFLRKKPKLWYHNHDIIEAIRVKKYSISWFALRVEQKAFDSIDLFTFPSEERKSFFPMHRLKGKAIFLPNYPLKKQIRTTTLHTPVKKLNLIYQGNIGEGHGLIEIIHFVKNHQLPIDLCLTLIGNCDEKFKLEILETINHFNLQDKVQLMPPVPYSELKTITESHNVGLAIHQPVNIAFKTAATSSNKIYEYVACGIPVLLADTIAYREKLQHNEWAFFTDLSEKSLTVNFVSILNNYQAISKAARLDFETKLNFEHYFSQVLTIL